LIQGIKDDPNLTLQLVVTGTHLSSEFGLTYRQIEADGFDIDFKVKTIGKSDSPVDVAGSIADGIRGCSEAFSKLQPDIIVLLGDRFEILAAATAALPARIPIAHIHGGEATEGLIDEAIRHSLTKMSHLHFVAAEEYRNRVVQLGENPSNVLLVGGLGLDSIKNINLLEKEELENSLNIKFSEKNLLITFHPVTLENDTAGEQMVELLAALSKVENSTLIFTLPNADTGGRIIIKLIEQFVRERPNAYSFQSLGQLKYLSCIKYVDGVVGNSSSGLIEVPSFAKGTINIGDRQRGRLKSKSVIDCLPTRIDIGKALEHLYSTEFQEEIRSTLNPYGTAGASEKIVKFLKEVDISGLIKKRFFDLELL
jgi:GDP/UDP-N,N'-diacetylbacillosamine 2-epimerase (hydrolysing)